MMMIGSNVDYVRSGGMRNVPVTKAVEHLYMRLLLNFQGAYSWPHVLRPLTRHVGGATPASVASRPSILMKDPCLADCEKKGNLLGKRMGSRPLREENVEFGKPLRRYRLKRNGKILQAFFCRVLYTVWALFSLFRYR
ncbi:hypothetical protein AVEN_181099-1 [Araneus ventricosus]|uniref:Uncharacterized protein n=1 Tax=Araneus ventricosus TaxID=182803 RepID=A0A4Y2T0K1_ARAVE|nr:hypothetical protein AVEN_181099-1 [Araneus ventricosus]